MEVTLMISKNYPIQIILKNGFEVFITHKIN